jgi:hypothetical protein
MLGAVLCTIYSLDNKTDLTPIYVRPVRYMDSWCKSLELFRSLLAGSCMAHCNLQLNVKGLETMRNKEARAWPTVIYS